MKWIIPLVLCLFLSGCEVFRHNVVEEVAPEVKIVWMDIISLNKACSGHGGCYKPTENTIYVLHGDYATLGHEYCHVLKGDPEHKDLCSRL